MILTIYNGTFGCPEVATLEHSWAARILNIALRRNKNSRRSSNEHWHWLKAKTGWWKYVVLTLDSTGVCQSQTLWPLRGPWGEKYVRGQYEYFTKTNNLQHTTDITLSTVKYRRLLSLSTRTGVSVSFLPQLKSHWFHSGKNQQSTERTPPSKCTISRQVV